MSTSRLRLLSRAVLALVPAVMVVPLLAAPAGAATLAAPTAVTATPGNAQASVSWTASATTAPTASGYTVTATDSTTAANGGQTCSTSLASSIATVPAPGPLVAYSSTPTVYAASTTTPSLSVIDATTQTVTTTVTLPAKAVALAVSPLGSPLYVLDTAGNLYSMNTSTDVLSAPLAAIPAGDTVTGMYIDSAGDTLYIVDATASTVMAVDAFNLTVTTAATALPFKPSAAVLSPDGSTLYVADAAGAVDTVATSSFAATSLLSDANGAAALALTGTGAGSTLYVAQTAGTLVSYTIASAALATTFSLNAPVSALTIDAAGTTLYGVSNASHAVEVVDLTTSAVTADVLVGTGPTSLALVGNTAFVADTGASSLSSFSTQSYAAPVTCTVTGLTNGDSYTFTVTAAFVTGTSAASTASAAVIPVGAPAAPALPAATLAAGSTVVLSWSAPASTGGSAITGYTVRYATSPFSTWTTAAATTTTYTSPALTAGTAYEFEVAATNAAGTSPYSAPTAITPITVPATATAPTATATGTPATSASLTWTATASTAAAPVQFYVVRYALSPYTTWTIATAGVTTASYTVTGLPAGSYEFEVAAANAAGLGAYSPASAALALAGAPGAPTALAGTPGNASVALTWTAPTLTNGSPITDYVVQYAVAPYTTWVTATSTATSTSYTVTGLVNATSYEFQVAAVNAIGTSSYSAPTAALSPATAPDAVANIATVVSSNRAVKISWTAPASNGGSPITGYTATLSPGDRSCTAAASATTCSLSAVAPGTYTVTVTATNAIGPSTLTGPLVVRAPVTVSILHPFAGSTSRLTAPGLAALSRVAHLMKAYAQTRVIITVYVTGRVPAHLAATQAAMIRRALATDLVAVKVVATLTATGRAGRVNAVRIAAS